jgi:hypothetical protein
MRLAFRFGFDIASVVEIRHPYKYIQESRFSARGGTDTATNYMPASRTKRDLESGSI